MSASAARGSLDRSRIATRSHGFAAALFGLTIVALVAWFPTKADSVLALALALIVAIATDSVLARRAVGRITPRLRGPNGAEAGAPISWVLAVEGYRRPVTVTVAIAPRPQRILVSGPDPVVVHLPASTRGVIHHLVVDVVATGPVGLIEAGRRFRVRPEAPVHVGPPAIPFDIRWPTPRAVGFGFTEVAPIGDELFRGIRPYVRGDEQRRVHWKATARHGQLMVREFDGTGVVALQIVVDLGPADPAAESVAAAAAWVADEAIRRGWLVQLVTLDSGSAEPPIIPVGSPFAPPPPPPAPVPQPLRTTAQRIRTEDAVRRQLATAAFGTPMAPRWTGMSCLVDRSGVTWR